MKKIYLTVIILGSFYACQSGTEQEQKLEQLDKTSAREVTLSSKETGDTILHITNQKIWSNNQLISEKIDTLKTVKTVADSIGTPIYVTIQ